jgi:hypothetical protein
LYLVTLSTVPTHVCSLGTFVAEDHHEIITVSFPFGCAQHCQCFHSPFWLFKDLACGIILLATT